MDQAYEALKIEKIRRFLSDKQKFERLVATVNRMLRCRSYGNAERAMTAEDIISELTKDALCSDRKWDMDKMPDFAGWVITQLRSKLSNLMRKQRLPVSLEEEMDKNGFDPPGDCGPAASFEIEEIIGLIEEELESADELGLQVFRESLRGCTNQEIAADLQIGVSEVENAKKRNGRRIDAALRRVRLSRHDLG